MIDNSISKRFSSKIAFLMSVLGIAIGTGNIWRFPRIVAQNGSEAGAGTFIVIWGCFLFAWSIPLIIAEYTLGRKYRMGLIGTIKMATKSRFTWVGTFMAMVATAITFFYSVVVGWCLYYLVYMILNPLPETPDTALQIWNNYQSSGWPFITHLFALIIGCTSILKGISSIEKINQVLIPGLLIILTGSAIRALTLDGAMDGITYLFTPDWDLLYTPTIWVEALTQNAWDTGAGWGLFLTYSAYMSSKQGIVKNAFFTGIGNNIISLIAALIIFGTVFAILGAETNMSREEILNVIKTSGPASTGLTFIWMPQLFSKLLGGHIITILFFLGLTFAGLSSLIAQLELPSRIIIDFGYSRRKSILIAGVLSLVLGAPSAMNLNILSNQDFVWGIALLLSGTLFSFVLVSHGLETISKKENNLDNGDWKIPLYWVQTIRYFIPLAGISLVVWFLIGAAQIEDWFHPIRSYSLMTCVLQWTLVIVSAILLQKKVNWKTKKPKSLNE